MNTSAMTNGTGAETRQEFKDAQQDPQRSEVALWVQELKNAERVNDDWFGSYEKIRARFRDERDRHSKDEKKNGRKYNALWSIVRTLQPNLYTELPAPFFKRKFSDADPVARDASMILERAVANELSEDDLHLSIKDARDDLILGSRGVIWLKYGADFELREAKYSKELAEGEDLPDEQKTRGAKIEALDGKRSYKPINDYKVSEDMCWEHVALRDMLHGPSAKWQHVPWIAKRVPMLKSEVAKRFGKDVAAAVPYTMTDRPREKGKKSNDDDKGLFPRAEVWEIWDRVERVVIWVAPHYTESILDKKRDILGLRNFFPCPHPVFGTKTNDSLIPVPDPDEWQDIANQLDDVSLRIKLLTEALAVKGVYNAEHGEMMKKLVRGKENDLIPVENWAMFAEGGGLKSQVDWFPLEQVVTTLDKLMGIKASLVQELYEITGISDIVRGSSDPRETLGAQQLKGQFASVRIKETQREIARMVREAYQMMVEVIAEHYDDRTIMAMSDAQQLLVDATGQFDTARWDAAISLIRSEHPRNWRIQVDNETLAGDDFMKEQQETKDFIMSVGGLLQQALPLAQQMPATAGLVKQLIMLGVRKFRSGRAVEAQFDATLDQLVEQAKNPRPEPQAGPQTGMTPEEIALENRKLDIMEFRLGIDRQRLVLDDQRAKGEHGLKAAQQTLDAQNSEKDRAVEMFKITSDNRLKAADAHREEHALAHQIDGDAQDRALTQRQHLFSEQQHADAREDAQQAAQREDQNAAIERMHSGNMADDERADAAQAAEADRQFKSREGAAQRTHASYEAAAERDASSAEAERNRQSAQKLAAAKAKKPGQKQAPKKRT